MRSRHGLEIRGPTGADLPGLSVLLAEAGHAIDTSELGRRLETLRQGAGTALIALEWGPPSGLVTLHCQQMLQTARPVAQITLLLVGPSERRRGIGRLLVEAAAQVARSAGCDALELVAPPGEPTIPAFGHALGFGEAGSRFVRALRKRR